MLVFYNLFYNSECNWDWFINKEREGNVLESHFESLILSVSKLLLLCTYLRKIFPLYEFGGIFSNLLHGDFN